jgi:CRP/FNR family nitrogen fixation transcriptional regulator
MEGKMYRQFGSANFDTVLHRSMPPAAASAQSRGLDELVALEGIGTRRSFARDQEIYAEGDASDSWYRLISGTVRLSKLLADGRRQIAEFSFPGDCFGLDSLHERSFSAEAVGDVMVMRYPRAATERLIDERPRLARRICEMTLHGLAHAQTRMLLLGRMTAPERVANFLMELSERRDERRVIEVPMSRNDIADYLGLTIETVCRVLSSLKRDGVIAIPNPHRIEVRDHDALRAVSER